MAIHEVAHAARFSLADGLRWTWSSRQPGTEQLHRLAQSKSVCMEQVYLIPKANWIHLKIQGQLVINCYPKKAHCTPATPVDISIGRDGELAELQFRMLATVLHWRREFSLGLRGGNWIAASPVFS